MSPRNRGFTLVEVMVIVTVIFPVLLAISNTTIVASKTIDTNEANAGVAEDLRRTTERLSAILRPAVLSSFEVRAVQADVDSGHASAVGEWFVPQSIVGRSTLRFRAVAGMTAFNAPRLTTTRELSFELERGELPNGRDDDGDGLVDEGVVHLRYENSRSVLVDGVETCRFTLSGRVLHLELACGGRDTSRRVHRATIGKVFYVRNS